ncbi:MAG: PEGA domain-containing protein [Deinococcus sp.]
MPVAPSSQDSPAAAAGAALTPIRIGFDDSRDWDLPEWTPDLAREGVAPQPAGESAHRAEAAYPPEAAGSPHVSPALAPNPTPAPPFPHAAAGTPKPGRPGSPRSQPVRIGWEEDHSWRVVRSVPSRAGPARRPWLSASGLPALVAALLGLSALGLGLYSYNQRHAVVSPCCTLAVQVSGAAGVPVRVTVQQAPPGSSVKVGALLGTAPGTLRFPNAPGRYQLRFEAKGHGAMLATVQLPSVTPLKVELK